MRKSKQGMPTYRFLDSKYIPQILEGRKGPVAEINIKLKKMISEKEKQEVVVTQQ